MRLGRRFWISRLARSLLCGPVLQLCQWRIGIGDWDSGPGQQRADLSPGCRNPGPRLQELPSSRGWSWAQELRVQRPGGGSQDRLPGRGVSPSSWVLKTLRAEMLSTCGAGTRRRDREAWGQPGRCLPEPHVAAEGPPPGLRTLGIVPVHGGQARGRDGLRSCLLCTWGQRLPPASQACGFYPSA